MSPRKALHFGIIIGGDVTYAYKDEQLGAGASFPSLSSLPRPLCDLPKSSSQQA